MTTDRNETTALLQTWVTRQAAIRPHAPAVILKDQKLTYSQLEKFSNQLAHRLKTTGCQRGDRVCLLMPKTPMAIVGILGIYKADCIYVPMDPASPAARLNKVFHSADSTCILGSILTANKIEELLNNEPLRSSTVVGWLDARCSETARHDFSLADVLSSPDTPPHYENTADDPAHILFTSGSTGMPKGVVITHANVITFVNWAVEYFGIVSSDRVSGQTPLCFDLSIFDIFGAFACGAELHLVPNDINLMPNKLADWIRLSRLTQWFSVPSILNYMAKFNVINYYDFPSLKRIMWCGEVLPVPSLIYWMQRLPNTRFTNLYGPTETTIASSYYTVPACPENSLVEIPIGRACADEELLVLDDKLNRVAEGDIGDLYIRGAGLSPGYWRDPLKTAECFINNPYSEDATDRLYKTGDRAWQGAEGLFYFAGRNDTQIKSRGYRIELGEIESALNTIEGLHECAVVATDIGGFEGKSICCAYVPVDDLMTSAMIREVLSGMLPAYMLPAHWKAYRSLPKNSNGKIDRRKLGEAFRNHPSTQVCDETRASVGHRA